MTEQAKAVVSPEPKAIDPQEIMDFLKPRMGARLRMWLNICARCGLCADTCHYYLANDKDPKMIPAYKVRFLRDILRKKGKIDHAKSYRIHVLQPHEEFRDMWSYLCILILIMLILTAGYTVIKNQYIKN